MTLVVCFNALYHSVYGKIASITYGKACVQKSIQWYVTGAPIGPNFSGTVPSCSSSPGVPIKFNREAETSRI